MKIIFLEDERLRKIIADRNKEMKRLLLNGTLKGACYTKLSTRESKDGKISYGWEITDLQTGRRIEELLGEKKEKIEPTGTIIGQRDYFFPIDQDED